MIQKSLSWWLPETGWMKQDDASLCLVSLPWRAMKARDWSMCFSELVQDSSSSQRSLTAAETRSLPGSPVRGTSRVNHSFSQPSLQLILMTSLTCGTEKGKIARAAERVKRTVAPFMPHLETTPTFPSPSKKFSSRKLPRDFLTAQTVYNVWKSFFYGMLWTKFQYQCQELLWFTSFSPGWGILYPLSS